MRLTRTSVVLAVLLALGRTAAAEPTARALTEARELFYEGDRLYRKGEYREALSAFSRSLQQSSRPSTIFNIAQCHRMLGDARQAVFHYRRYLAEWARLEPGTEPPHATEVNARIAQLEAQLAQRPRPDPPPAKPPAAAPDRADPPQAAVRTEGDRAANAHRPAPHDAPRTPRAAHRAARAPAIQKTRSAPTWTYATLGTGAALMAAAGVLYGLGAREGNDAHATYQQAAGSAPPTDNDAAYQHRSDVERARVKMNIATVLLGTGAVGVGYGVYRLLTRPGPPRGHTETNARPTLGLVPGAGCSVSVSGRF